MTFWRLFMFIGIVASTFAALTSDTGPPFFEDYQWAWWVNAALIALCLVVEIASEPSPTQQGEP